MTPYRFRLLIFFLIPLFSCKGPQSNAPVGEVPIVTAIYPSSDTLPENLLRMYIQFSQPMKTVGNLEKIHLIDQEGKEVEGAIFNNVYELWDTEQKQLTLIFDPGRVKTGLSAHNTMGRALIAGQSYQLAIKELEDIHHQKLASPYTKKFYVSFPDSLAPNPAQWKWKVPLSQSQAALTIHFPEMIDQMSLHHRLLVANSQGTRIPGTVEFGKSEKAWKFIPDRHWNPGEYFLHVNTRLEDPAGNNVNGLFDHKIGSLKSEQEGQTQSIRFYMK